MEQSKNDAASAARLAAARYVPNEDTYIEMVFLQRMKRRRTMLLGGAILVALSGVQMMAELTDQQHFMLLGALSLAGFGFILWAQYGHLFSGKRLYRSLIKQYGKKDLPGMEQVFYADRVEVHAEKSEQIRSYPYQKLTQIRETKTMIMLVMEGDSGVCVPRSAFVEGSSNDVVKYIRSHFELKKF